jgi:hypothetical protein
LEAFESSIFDMAQPNLTKINEIQRLKRGLRYLKKYECAGRPCGHVPENYGKSVFLIRNTAKSH